MRLDGSVSEGSSRFVPGPFRLPLANAAEMSATADVFGDQVPLNNLRSSARQPLELDGGDLNADRIQQLADVLICPEDLRFLLGTSDPAFLSSHFTAQSAIARWFVDSVIWLTDRATTEDASSRGYRVLLKAPLFCVLVLLRAVIHTF